MMQANYRRRLRLTRSAVTTLVVTLALVACARAQSVRWDGEGSQAQFKVDKRACEVITNNEVGTRSFEQPTGRTTSAEKNMAARRFARSVYGACMAKRGWRPADGAPVPPPGGIAYP